VAIAVTVGSGSLYDTFTVTHDPIIAYMWNIMLKSCVKSLVVYWPALFSVSELDLSFSR